MYGLCNIHIQLHSNILLEVFISVCKIYIEFSIPENVMNIYMDKWKVYCIENSWNEVSNLILFERSLRSVLHVEDFIVIEFK